VDWTLEQWAKSDMIGQNWYVDKLPWVNFPILSLHNYIAFTMQLSLFHPPPIMILQRMTRMLTNNFSGPLQTADLEAAKETLRQKCLIGLTTKMEESISRIEMFFGWKPKDLHRNGHLVPGSECRNQYFGNRGVHLNKNKHPPVVPGSDTWRVLEEVNRFDLPLYQYAVQLFDEQAKLFASRESGSSFH